eukprot:TRINITY_DN8708_c0_g1_i1.p2 TRINITY_DN8708_c0_g1~~TRINITY_DN8708_c0_g1_i1.p2  ORF type:complete len:124 (+),score=37.42 TRINITY_DN8708_c0_g1_i1:372-743(+)
MEYINKIKHTGRWKKGKEYGRGRREFSNGKVEEGIYREGRIDGKLLEVEVTCRDSNGSLTHFEIVVVSPEDNVASLIREMRDIMDWPLSINYLVHNCEDEYDPQAKKVESKDASSLLHSSENF